MADSDAHASRRSTLCEEAEAAYARFEAEMEAAAANAVSRARSGVPTQGNAQGSRDARGDDNDPVMRHRGGSGHDSGEEVWSDSDDEPDDPSALIYADACKEEKVFPCRQWLTACVQQVTTCELKHYGLGPRGVGPLAKSLSVNANICVLDLSENRLGGDGIAAVFRAIRTGGPQRVQHLDLSQNQAGAEGTEALATFLLCSADKQPGPKLTTILFDANGMADKGAAKLAPALGALPGLGFMAVKGKAGPCLGSSLRRISLARNEIAGSGRAICAALENNSTIESVDLSWNQITDGLAIAAVIRENRTLRALDLSWNGMGDGGAIALAAAMSKAPEDARLTSLSIGRNRLSAEGARALAPLCGMLQVLDVSGNPIGAEGAKPLLAGYQMAMAASWPCKLVANDICVREGTPVSAMLLLVAKAEPLEADVLVNVGKPTPAARMGTQAKLGRHHAQQAGGGRGGSEAYNRADALGVGPENGDDAFEIRPRRFRQHDNATPPNVDSATGLAMEPDVLAEGITTAP